MSYNHYSASRKLLPWINTVSLILIALVISIPLWSAWADESPEEESSNPTGETKEEENRRLFRRANGLYKTGQYLEAAGQYLSLYASTGQDELLYNIALCYEKDGKYIFALKYYRQFLAFRSDDAETLGKIEKMEKAIADEAAGAAKSGTATQATPSPEPAASTPPPSPNPAPPKKPSHAPSITLAVFAGISLVVGGAMLGIAGKLYDDYSTSCAPFCDKSKGDGITVYSNAGWGLMIGGTVSFGVSAIAARATGH